MIPRPILALKVSASGLSDIGLVRQNNEDVWAELPKLHFYLLADGMGGHLAGEIAAREAVDTFCRMVEKAFKDKSKSLEESATVIKQTLEQVNAHVFKMSRSSIELKGMGTTLCALHIHEDGVIIAHVGDSRIYRFRKGNLLQMTKDHSLVSELVELGQIAEHQASDFVYKNIITRAIGTEATVEPSVQIEEYFPEDIYLLCSDGLSDLLSIKEMETIIKGETLLSQSIKALVDRAKEKGGHDNITLVMVKIHEKHEKDTQDLS